MLAVCMHTEYDYSPEFLVSLFSRIGGTFDLFQMSTHTRLGKPHFTQVDAVPPDAPSIHSIHSQTLSVACYTANVQSLRLQGL